MTERSECKFVHGNVNLMVETKPQKRKKKNWSLVSARGTAQGPQA